MVLELEDKPYKPLLIWNEKTLNHSCIILFKIALNTFSVFLTLIYFSSSDFLPLKFCICAPCITVHGPVFRLWTPLSHFSEGQPGGCYGLNQYAGIPTPRRVKTGPWEVTAGTTAFTGRPSELPHPSSCVRTQCEGGHPWTEAGPHQTPPASKTVRKQRLWCSAVTAQTDRDKGPGGAGATTWTAAYQAPPSMGFSRQEYWSGLPFPSPEDLPHLGIKPKSPALQADSLPAEL